MSGDTTAAAPAEKPVARIKTDVPREKTVPLQWPVEFGDALYESIVIRRITGGEVADYMDRLQRGERLMPPVVDCPVEVYEAMDADDQFMVDEAAMDFLPRQLKTAAG